MNDILVKASNSILNDIQTRYALALFTVLAGCVYRSPKASTRITVAVLSLYLAYGMKQLLFIVLVLSLNITIMRVATRHINEYVFIVLNIGILYFFKIFGYHIEPLIQTTYDISGFLMTLVIKVSYLVRDYRILRESKRADQVATTDIIEYLVFLPGLLSGPTTTFQEFLAIDRTEARSIPWKDTLKTLSFLFIYLKLGNYPFKARILSDNTPIMHRLILLYFYNFVLRTTFHFIWSFANCCYISHGCNGLLNIDFYKVEFTESIREISSNWDIFVSRWLKEMFFLKLKNNGASPTVAALITYLASASLHGLNACYLIFFMSLGIFSKLITRINRIIPFKPLRQLQMVGFVTFFSMPFYLLSLKDTYVLWKAVYFYGLVYCVGMSIIFILYDLVTKKHLAIPTPKSKIDVFIKNK